MKAWKTSSGDFLNATRAMVALVALMLNFFSPLVQSAQAADKSASTPTKDAAVSLPTASPIKHVIIISGENRSFDHLFATYQPKSGNTVNNLLSEGIIDVNGAPGPNFSLGQQYSADVSGSTTFQLSPTTGKAPYTVLPPELNGGPSNVCTDNGMCNIGDAYNTPVNWRPGDRDYSSQEVSR